MTKESDKLATRTDTPNVHGPKVALVLGGGGIKGMAHVGALEVLEKAGITFDLIVGCSAGAIVGAVYADGKDVQQLKKIAFDIVPFSRNYRLFGIPSLYKGLLKGYGLFSMKKISKYLAQVIHAKTFEELQIPLIVVATSLTHGHLVSFDHGKLIPTLCASSAIPGIFQPITIAKDQYVDGYLLAPLPVFVARAQGARVVIGLNISNKPALAHKSGSLNVLLHSFEIVASHRIQASLSQADIIIDPNFVGESHLFTNKKGATKLYEAGKKAAEKVLPAIQKAIDNLG